MEPTSTTVEEPLMEDDLQVQSTSSAQEFCKTGELCLTTCCICRKPVGKTAKLLPCLHVVCNPCVITGTIDGRITCDFCHNTCESRHVVDHFLLPHIAKAKVIPNCTFCKENGNSMLAVCHCTECEDDLCSDCSLAHRRVKLTKDHMLIQLEGSIAVQETSRCTKHKNEDMQWFCLTCSQMTCRDCQLESHSGHSYKSLEEHAQSSIASLREFIEAYNNKINQSDETLRFINQHFDEIEQRDVAMRAELETLIGVIHKKIIERGGELLIELSNIISTKRNQLKSVKRRCVDIRAVMEQVLYFSNVAIDCANRPVKHSALNAVKAISDQISQWTNLLAQEMNQTLPIAQLVLLAPTAEFCEKIRSFGSLSECPRMTQLPQVPHVANTSAQSSNPSSSSGLVENLLRSAMAPEQSRNQTALRNALSKPVRKPRIQKVASFQDRPPSIPLTSIPNPSLQPSHQQAFQIPSSSFVTQPTYQSSDPNCNNSQPRIPCQLQFQHASNHPACQGSFFQARNSFSPSYPIVGRCPTPPVGPLPVNTQNLSNNPSQHPYMLYNQNPSPTSAIQNAPFFPNAGTPVRWPTGCRQPCVQLQPRSRFLSSAHVHPSVYNLTHMQHQMPNNSPATNSSNQVAFYPVPNQLPSNLNTPNYAASSYHQITALPPLRPIVTTSTASNSNIVVRFVSLPPSVEQSTSGAASSPCRQTIRIDHNRETAHQNHSSSSLPTPNHLCGFIEPPMPPLYALNQLCNNSNLAVSVSDGDKRSAAPCNVEKGRTKPACSNDSADSVVTDIVKGPAVEPIGCLVEQGPGPIVLHDISPSLPDSPGTTPFNKLGAQINDINSLDEESFESRSSTPNKSSVARLAKKSITRFALASNPVSHAKDIDVSTVCASRQPITSKNGERLTTSGATESIRREGNSPKVIPDKDTSLSAEKSSAFNDHESSKTMQSNDMNKTIQTPIEQALTSYDVTTTDDVFMAPVSNLSDDSRWDDYCSVCQNGGDLICCEAPNCRRVFHITDHVPIFDDIPKDRFICSFCIKLDDYLTDEDKIPYSQRRSNSFTPYQQKVCEKILLELICEPDSSHFHLPMDEDFHEYYKIVKNPIDFSAIRSKLCGRVYTKVEDFLTDLNLVFLNCALFYADDTEAGKAGIHVGAHYRDLVAKYCHEFSPISDRSINQRQQFSSLQSKSPSPTKIRTKRKKINDDEF